MQNWCTFTGQKFGYIEINLLEMENFKISTRTLKFELTINATSC
jgi:hypothetical protein